MRELALHLLDIAENSISASANEIHIKVIEDTRTDRLEMSVQDNGAGMDAETVARVVDPFFTSRTTRKVGLGIPLLKEAAEACRGNLTIVSKLGEGTLLEVDFQRSHIDRMPLGDLPETFLTLMISAPLIHWIFEYQADEAIFCFDDVEIKTILGDVSLTEPDVLAFLRKTLTSGIEEIKPAASEFPFVQSSSISVSLPLGRRD